MANTFVFLFLPFYGAAVEDESISAGAIVMCTASQTVAAVPVLCFLFGSLQVFALTGS